MTIDRNGCGLDAPEPSFHVLTIRFERRVRAGKVFRRLPRERIPNAFAIGAAQPDRREDEGVALGVVQAHRYRTSAARARQYGCRVASCTSQRVATRTRAVPRQPRMRE